MTNIHIEKINYLFSTDKTGKPIARYGVSTFPTSTIFVLQSLFFDFEVDKEYEILVNIENSSHVSLVKSKNNYVIDKNSLSDISFTDKEHKWASTTITIKTPIVNIVAEDIYEFTISVNDEKGNLLDTKKTYAAIRKNSNSN